MSLLQKTAAKKGRLSSSVRSLKIAKSDLGDLITRCEKQADKIQEDLESQHDGKNTSRQLRKMTKYLQRMTPCLAKQGQEAINLANHLQEVDDKLAVKRSATLDLQAQEFRDALNNYLKLLSEYPGARQRGTRFSIIGPVKSSDDETRDSERTKSKKRKFGACVLPSTMPLKTFVANGKQYEILVDTKPSSERVNRTGPITPITSLREMRYTNDSTRTQRTASSPSPSNRMQVVNRNTDTSSRAERATDYSLDAKTDNEISDQAVSMRSNVSRGASSRAEQSQAWSNDKSKTEEEVSYFSPMQVLQLGRPSDERSINAERVAGFSKDKSKTEEEISYFSPAQILQLSRGAEERSNRAERETDLSQDKSKTEQEVSYFSQAQILQSSRRGDEPSTRAEREANLSQDKSKTEGEVSYFSSAKILQPRPLDEEPSSRAERETALSQDKSKTEEEVSYFSPAQFLQPSRRGNDGSTTRAERVTSFSKDESKTEEEVSSDVPTNLWLVGRSDEASSRAERATGISNDRSRTEDVLSDRIPSMRSRKSDRSGGGSFKAERTTAFTDDASKTEAEVSETAYTPQVKN